MKPSREGSTLQLLQFSFAYFFFYILTGLCVKYFQSPASLGFPGISEWQFLIYSTMGSALVCLGVVLARGWWRHQGEWHEYLFLFLSGTCTAIVIPTTTLMYSLPISVMVAMVIMRGSIIFISRVVDFLLQVQGISKRKVYWEENLAVLLSLAAVSAQLLEAKSHDFAFLESRAALLILGSYIVAYGIRIYLMNYFKHTFQKRLHANNKNYFAIEQISASFWIFGATALIAFAPFITEKIPFITPFHDALKNPPSLWLLVALAGMPFGFSAFFSLFLFMFKGRSSTFAGLVNRLASLLAGTISTLLFAHFFGGKYPKPEDWISFILILVAVAFLAHAEKKRVRELQKEGAL